MAPRTPRSISDRALVAWCAFALFALVAWPLLVVHALPLQDLPNHLATEIVSRAPKQYPEYISNGLFKTNSALFLWLRVFGGLLGLESAAKVFVALVLAVSAFAWPRAAFVFGGRQRVLPATLLAWPLVHSWFVCMGMLDYALGAALGILLVCEVERSVRARRPTLIVAGLAVCVWYTHAFALGLAALFAVMLVTERVRKRELTVKDALAFLSPLLLGLTFCAWSFTLQASESPVAEHALVRRPLWEVGYDLWALFGWAFTRREATSLVAVLALAALAVRPRESSVRAWMLIALLGLYLALPYETDAWFAVSVRVLPFLYLACIARLPEKLPRSASAVLVACALAYSIGLGLDYARLSTEVERYASAAVPAESRVLPLTFEPKGSSENTAPLAHAWGLYAVRDGAIVPPLVFGHSPSFPVSYRAPQAPPFDDLRYAAFLDTHASCASAACELDWADFWQRALARFDRLIVWKAPPQVLARIPARYAKESDDGALRVYVRQPP